MPLDFVGMPGCFGHVSWDAMTATLLSQGRGILRLFLRPLPQIVGLEVHAQAFVDERPDPTVTNAILLVVGSR